MSIQSQRKRATRRRKDRRAQHREEARTQGARPSPELRARIADAVHQVISDWLPEDAPEMCTFYAAVGLLVIRVVTGDKDYLFQAGSMTAQIREDGLCMKFDATDPVTRGYEHHAWIAKIHQNHSDSEIIDLSSRHYYTQARCFGMEPTLPPPPDYIWLRVRDLARENRYFFQAYGETAERVFAELFNEHYGDIKALAARAIAIVMGDAELPPLPPPLPEVNDTFFAISVRNDDGSFTPLKAGVLGEEEEEVSSNG